MPESEPSPELAKTKAKIAASDPLVRMINEAAARSEGEPLVSRGSFAQYAEDDHA
jgi:hypothetical protein